MSALFGSDLRSAGAARPARRSFVWLAAALAIGWTSLSVGPAETSAMAQAVERGAASDSAVETATFAAGCFWCVESDFDSVRGVISTTSGYTGGRLANPTYRQVSSGGTGHTEAVAIQFDPKVVSYATLLEHFWRNVDPFVAHRQFCDVGDQYRPEIFVHDAAQRAAAETSLRATQARFRMPIVVRISDAKTFYKAEEYHQDYYMKNPLRYKYYRWTCGRDRRLAEIWGST
jgi:peptide-methionine (S)-S-oxide reductase